MSSSDLTENGARPLLQGPGTGIQITGLTKTFSTGRRRSVTALDDADLHTEQGSFLEIELAARRGVPHETCGGRALNDDVMDTFFTQLINAGNGPVIRDGVDHSSRPASRSFPYLAPPNPNPPEPPAHHH